MKKAVYLLSAFFLMASQISAQSGGGHWDVNMKTERQIILDNFLLQAEGERECIEVTIPVGTTQLMYVVRFLSTSEVSFRQKLSGLLMQVPDPHAQAAGAFLALVDAFGGDNKGKYYIFKNKSDADYYVKNGVANNYCLASSDKIPGDKNFLSLEQDKCLHSTTDYLYFVFYNMNHNDDEKVTLEVLPYINDKASRGWNVDFKNEISNGCINEGNSPKVCLCYLEKLQTNFTAPDYQNLANIELNDVKDAYIRSCKAEVGDNITSNSGEDDIILLREAGFNAFESKDYSTCAEKFTIISNNQNSEEDDHLLLAVSYIYMSKYSKARDVMINASLKWPASFEIKRYLAHTRLLNNELDDAKSIYLRYKGIQIAENYLWETAVNQEFDDFIASGVSCTDFQTIRNLLK